MLPKKHKLKHKIHKVFPISFSALQNNQQNRGLGFGRKAVEFHISLHEFYTCFGSIFFIIQN